MNQKLNDETRASSSANNLPFTSGHRGSRLPVLLLLAGALLAPACDDHDDGEGENPNEEACEHMKGGPMKAVTAAAAASVSAPAIDDDHQRYDVSLVGPSGAKVGFLTFAAAAHGEIIVFTNAPVTVSLKSPAGTAITAKSTSASIGECSEVKGRHQFEVEVGTHSLEIGPETTLDKVSLVVEPVAHTHTH